MHTECGLSKWGHLLIMRNSIARFAVEYLKDIPVHDLGFDRYLPSFLNFSISNRCNAKCVMCDIWKHPSRDLTGDLLKEMISNDYLQAVRDLGITGGEPFIRADLAEIISLIVRRFPKLRQIAITTNGFNTARIEKTVPRLLEILSAYDVRLIITVSVDGLGETHSRSRGVPDVWQKVQQTIEYLRNLKSGRLVFSTACTISKANADYTELRSLADYMTQRNIPIIFRLAVYVSRIYNDELIEKCGLRPQTPEAQAVVGFLKEFSQRASYSWRSEYYDFIVSYLSGEYSVAAQHAGSRPLCKEQRDGGMLDSNGDMYVCSVSGQKIGNLLDGEISKDQVLTARKLVRKNFCDTCFHDHSIHPRFSSVTKALIKKISSQHPILRTN